MKVGEDINLINIIGRYIRVGTLNLYSILLSTYALYKYRSVLTYLAPVAERLFSLISYLTKKAIIEESY